MKRLLLTLGLLILSAQAVLSLPQPIGRDRVHTVAEQETIFTISRKYGLAPDHVMWANDLDLDSTLSPGRELTIPLRRIPPFAPPESTAVVLNLPERMIYLFRGGQVAGFWGVAIGGPQYPTPDGNFRVIAKEKNPTWLPPSWLEQPAIGPGPDNPLGDRWIQITGDMVGIHGTNNPDSIGGVASLGCIRLYPESVHTLYDQVGVGTPVYVTYEQARVGVEPDGTLVWSFFPDPYAKYYSTRQAQQLIAEARQSGIDIALSDFEIKERAGTPNGVITPVFGIPVNVEGAAKLEGISALRKPTGIWLNPTLFEAYGFKVERKRGQVTIISADGQQLTVAAQTVPLNPHRLPRLEKDEPLELEGHSWRGTVWIPFPLALDYFKVPYSWDDRASLLTITAQVDEKSDEDAENADD